MAPLCCRPFVLHLVTPNSPAASFPLLSHVASKLAPVLPQVAPVVAPVTDVLAELSLVVAKLSTIQLDLIGPTGLAVPGELPLVPDELAPVLTDVTVVLPELAPVLTHVLPVLSDLPAVLGARNATAQGHTTAPAATIVRGFGSDLTASDQ